VPTLNFTEVIVYDELSMWLKNKKIKIPFLNDQGLKVYLFILNPSLLFNCFLGCLPIKPFQLPLIWYINHLSRSHRS